MPPHHFTNARRGIFGTCLSHTIRLFISTSTAALGVFFIKMHSTHTMPHFSNQSEPICANISFTQLHKITVFNANGTKAGFCGNGFRCVANLLAQFKHAHICLQTETGQLVLAQTAPTIVPFVFHNCSNWKTTFRLALAI